MSSETGISDNPNVLGDLVLTPEQMKLLDDGNGTAQGLHYLARRWPNGVVPFQFHPKLSELQTK